MDTESVVLVFDIFKLRQLVLLKSVFNKLLFPLCPLIVLSLGVPVLVAEVLVVVGTANFDQVELIFLLRSSAVLKV